LTIQFTGHLIRTNTAGHNFLGDFVKKQQKNPKKHYITLLWNVQKMVSRKKENLPIHFKYMYINYARQIYNSSLTMAVNIKFRLGYRISSEWINAIAINKI
jgi:hypothetical protein